MILLSCSIALSIAGVIIFALRPKFSAGDKAESVHDYIHDCVIAEAYSREAGRSIYISRGSSGGSGLLQTWCEFQVKQNHPIATCYVTYKLDNNGMIVSVESDWVWWGF